MSRPSQEHPLKTAATRPCTFGCDTLFGEAEAPPVFLKSMSTKPMIEYVGAPPRGEWTSIDWTVTWVIFDDVRIAVANNPRRESNVDETGRPRVHGWR